MAAALIGLLNEAAGEYVEGLERSQLDFSGALTGKVLLRHLQLKKKAFELLPFPAEPEFNYIGRVQLDIPVYSLGTAPLLAEVRDVLLLLSVRPSDSWDAEGFLAQYQQQKAEALAAGEYKALFSSLEKGLLWQLLLKLLSSFTAKVQDVHVRIEDRQSISGKPFALGLCLKSAVLHAAPRGEDFLEPGVCKANGGLADDTFFKVISVEGLGLYVDSLSVPASLCASATRERERSGGPGGEEGGSEWRASKRDRRRSSAGSSTWQRASGRFSGDKGYNATCRDAYEAITAQVLQEETARAQEAQGAEASKPKGAARLGFVGVNTPWVQRRRSGAPNESQCPPCVSTLCCSAAPSHSSILEEEAVSLGLRPASRRRSSGFSRDFREGFSHISMGSIGEQRFPSLSSESGMPPDPAESWVPLLRRFYREETPSPSETESNLAATLAGFRGDSGGPASSLQRQLTGSLRVLSWTRLIDPESKGGRELASPLGEGLLRSSEASEASSRAIPKRPAFLPPINAGGEPQQQQQQQQQQQGAAASATVTGAKPQTRAVDSPDAAAGPAAANSEAEERRRNRSNSNNSSNSNSTEDSFYDAEESPFAAASAAEASNTADSAGAESKAATSTGSAATSAQQRQQQQQPEAKERMQPLDKEKLDDFREFFALLWDVQHEYVLSPDTFKGQGKMFLTLVPTLPRDAPLERCWSPWGQQRAALVRAEKGEQCLPSCTLFLTLPGLKVTLSSSQALQLWKWLEFCFVLRGAWEAGLLGTLEKARASPGDTQRYLLCWPVKLLRCPQPLSMLRDAGLLFTSKEDAELASKGEGDVQMQPHARALASQPTITDKDQKENPLYIGEQQQEGGEDVFEGLETLEEIDAFCKTFEECHSLQTICVLRAKALRRLVALRDILASQEERQSTWRRAWQWLSGVFISRRESIDLAAAQGDPRKLAAASVNIVEKFIEQNGVSSSRLRQVREHFFSVDFALDLAISDLQLLVVCEGRGVAVPAPRYGQRLLAVECACLHYHLQIGVTGDQTLSMDVEVYPTTVLTVARDLESALIPPEVSVLLLLEPSRQRTKQKRKGNRFFNVLQKVLGRGEDAETAAEQDPLEEPHTPAATAVADSDDGGRALGNTNAMLSAAAADDAKEGMTTRVKDYRKQLESTRAWSPGVYMRMDSQLFRTLYAPDLRMLLHSCAGIVVVVSPQRCLLVLGESLNLIDAARTKELLLSSNIQRAALLRQGEAFCSAVAGGDIQHPNLLLDVELHKTVSFVMPRLASRLDCEGIQIDLGSIKAKSLLQPRRLSYPLTMDVESLLDTYSCELSGLTVGRTSSCSRDLMRLRMFLGGMVLPFPKQLSSLLQLSAAATAAATATVAGGHAGADQQQTAEPGGYMDAAGTAAAQQQQQGGRHDEDTAKPPAEHRRVSSGGDESFPCSFIVRHVKTSVISLKIAHDKFRTDVPTFHVDVIQEGVSVSISQHDIELLANIAAESLEIFYSYSARLEAILREAEEQQAALDACILEQMQATCVELEQQQQQLQLQQQQQQQLQQQQQEGSDVERNLSHAEETVVSFVAASGIDYTAALIATQLAISRTRAQEALASASNTLMNSQQGVMSIEIHCVLAGFRVALLRRGPTISPKKGSGDAAGPPETDEAVSFGNLSAAPAAAAAAGSVTVVPSLATFATGLRSLTARQASSPPGSPQRQHQRRCRWAADTQGAAFMATVATAGGSAFAGFAAAAASAAEGLAAQQHAASLISGEGGGGAEGAASSSSVPGGGLLPGCYGGWLSACLPLTEPSLGEAYRPYHTVAPLVTLVLGECFVEAVTSTDGNAQLHVALQGVELRDDTNIAPLCLSSLYLGWGVIQYPQGDAGAAEAPAPAGAKTSKAPSAASQHHHHQHRGEGPAAAGGGGKGQVSPTAASRSRQKSSAAARLLADTQLVLEEQKLTSKKLARARTSVVVLETRALGPRHQRGKCSPQQQHGERRKSQLMVSGVESGFSGEESSDGEAFGAPASYRENSLCPMLLCCPGNPHFELRLQCSAMEETAESVLSFSKARVVLVWEVLHEVLRVAGQLVEELPAFPSPPAPAPVSPKTQWKDTKARHASRSVMHAPLKPEEQLDVIVKRLLLARKKSVPFPQTRGFNTRATTGDSRWYSVAGVESKAATNAEPGPSSASTSAPAFPRQQEVSPHPSAARTASLPQQFLKAFPLRPSTCLSFSPTAFPLQGQQQEQLLPLEERLMPLEEQQRQEQEEQQQQEEQEHQQEEQQQQQEGKEDAPGALPKWVPLPSGGVSSLLNSERLLHAIEVTRFGSDDSSSAFIEVERTAPKRRTALAEMSGDAVQQRKPWGLPRSAFARGENVKAVACGGGPEAFNRSNRLPRLNLLLQIHQIELWLPTEPVRMPYELEGDTAANKRVSAGLTSLSTLHSDRRKEQQHLDGAEGDGMNKSNFSPSNTGIPSTLGIFSGSGPAKKGKLILNKLRFDHGGSGESKTPTEPTGTSILRRRKNEMQQQQLHALPEYLVTAPLGFVSGLASAAAGITGTTWKGKRTLLSAGRSSIGVSPMQQQQQQLLHTSTLGKRSYARQRPTAAEYWKGLRKLVLARHRSSPEGAAVITAFAAKIPKLIALSAALELTVGIYSLKQRGDELEADAEKAAAKETFISELEHVRKLEQSGKSPLQLLAPFCPCLLRCGLSVSSICAVTTQPEFLSPLLPCAISWETLKLNSPLLSPTRLQLRTTLCLPSFSTLNERVWGISPEASAAIRGRYGVLTVPEPEGLTLTVNLEPVLLTLDTFSVVLAYQLLAIVGAVFAAAADLFAAPPAAQEAYRGMTGDASDTFTSAPKSLPVGLPHPRSNPAAAGGAPTLLCEQQPSTEEETGALRRHSVGASGMLNPVLESFIAEQQAQQQQRQQQLPTHTDFALPQGIGGPVWVSPEETPESSEPHELTANEALEGLLHTTAFGVEVSAELFRVALWDTFSVSRKCCFTLTIEDVQLRASSDPRSTEMIPFDPTTSTIVACSNPLVATCCAVLQREELVARHQRLRLRFRRMKGSAIRDGTMHQRLQQTETQQLQHAGSTTVTWQQDTSNSFGGPLQTWKASDGALASKDSLVSSYSSRKQRRKQKQQLLLQQLLQQQQEQRHNASCGMSGPWQTSYSTGDGSNSFLLGQRTADLDRGGDEDSPIASMAEEGRLQGSDSLLGLPWTEERREVTGSDIASAWSTNEVTWRLWRDLDQQQQQQQKQLPGGRLGLPMLEAVSTTVGSVGAKQGQQQQQHGAAAAPQPKRKMTRLPHWKQHGIHGRRQNGRKSVHVPKAFQLWLVSQYRSPANVGSSAPGGGMAAAGAGGQGASKGHGDTAEETVVGGSRLRRGVMASEPWVTSEASFVLSAEHLNRLEGTTDATLEPWRVETVGSKACLSSPTLLDVHASWLNLNVNVALLDALLVYGYAFIGVVVRQRSLLLLNQRRLGPKPLPPTVSTAGGASQAVGTLRRGESAENRSLRQPGGPLTEAVLAELQLQGICGSEGSDISQMLAIASAAAAEVPDCYAVLRPDGTVVGSGGFDLFNALQNALSLELLGDHLLQKTSGQLSPSAEFAGDQLKVAKQQQQQQQLTAAAPDGNMGAQGKDKENGRPTQLLQIAPRPQQQHASSAAAAADAGGAAAEPTGRQQENSNPLLYNLLGQPIAIMTGLHCDDGADVLSGSWFTVADQSSFPLPLDENNRVLPFLVRLRLFNYVYDLPSQVFCFSAETREVLRLSVPENPLPPTIHMQHEGGNEAGDEASDSQQKRHGSAKAAKQGDDAGSGFRATRTNRIGGPRGLGPSAKIRRRGWWVPSALPRPRTSVYLLWRTSAFASVSGTPRHDLFLSSCISLRNNTELSLAVLPTIPGPLDERRSVFAAFRKKFEVQPSKPPTDSMPPFARVIEAFKQQERRIKKRQTQQQQQQQQVTTFPPVLKLPAMEHYIIEDPTSTDIGRKFSMIADNPSTDDEGVAAAPAAGGVMSAAAAVAAFTTSNTIHSGGRVKFAMEGLIEQQHQVERRMQTTVQRDTFLTPLEQQQLGTKQPESAEAEAAEADAAAGAASGGETGGEESGDRQQGMSSTSEEERQEEAESGKSSPRRSLEPPPEAQHLLSAKAQRGKKQERKREERERTRRGSRRNRPHTSPKQKQPQEKVPLVQGVDYIVLDAKERQLLPVPLFWLLTENAPLWCCLAERLPKYKHKVRRFVAHPKNADFLADERSQRAISGGLLAKYRPKRTPVPPKQIHIDEGVALSASVVGVALRSSGMARGNVNGLFFEVVLEHCLCVCNRLPRPIMLRFSPRDCGGQQQQAVDSFMAQPPTEIQVEAGSEVSLAADPAHVTVYFGSRLSKPVAVDYFTPGTKVQRVTMDNTSDELSSCTAIFSRVEGDSALLSPHSGSRSASLDLLGRDGKRDRSFPDSKGLGQELLHEPSSLLLWGEVTDHKGTAKVANSATAQRIYHGTFVRTLTLFADFWVVNRTGYVLLLRRHGNGWLQSLPPFQRVVLSHDFGASRLSVGLPASQYSKVKDFDLYAKKEQTKLSRCLHAAFAARTDTAAWSGEFLLSDMGAYQIQLERTEANPLLHYSVSMGIAPAPFSRTTVVEILPAYVLVNETQKTLWICEAGVGPEARFHMLDPGAVVEFHPQAKRPVAILITGIPQRGLLRRHARANMSWQGSYGQLTADEESKQHTLSISVEQQPQQQQQQQQQHQQEQQLQQPLQEMGTTDMSEALAKSQNGIEGLPQLSLSRKLGAMASTDTQSIRSRFPTQQQQQGMQRQASPDASSCGLAGSCSVSVQLPQLQHGDSEAPMSHLSSHSGPWPSSIKRKTSIPSNNAWQLEEETRAEGTAGMVWSGPVDIDSARLVQVRHPQETRQIDVPAAAAGRPLTRASSYLSKNSESSFCLTEVEVCLYSGARFVRLHDPSIPDFVLLNKTSFPLYVGQHGVPAYEVVCPVPRQHLKRSYEFLGSRYGLPFAFYDPTKEKKLEVWRMSSASAPLTHRLSGRLSHLHSRLRSGSRQGLTFRTSGVGRGPPVGDATVHPQGSGGARSGHSWSLSHIANHKKGEGPPRFSRLPSSVSGQDIGGRCDANTLRRIRREYAESISMKGSQGQQGLIRLVLQSITGPVVQGGPPPQVERVVVCVRRPVVKGSTYLVFFEATRFLPEVAKGSFMPTAPNLLGGLENVRESLLELEKVPGSMGIGGMGTVRERMLQLANTPLPSHMQHMHRPDVILAHGTEKTLKTSEGGSLPWQSEDRQGERSCSVPETPSPPYPPMAAGAGVSNELSHRRSMSAGRPPGAPSLSTLASGPQGVGGSPSRNPETPDAPLIPRLPGWLHMDGLLGAGEDALRFVGGAAEATALHGASALRRRKLRRRGRQRLNAGEEDIEVGESDEEETDATPLCSTDLSVNLFLVGAGLSLIDSKPAEIFYASVELLQVFFKKTQEGEKLRLTVGWVQIDNHAPMAYYPTMLRPITDVRANVSPTGLSANAKPLQQAPSALAAADAPAAKTPQGGEEVLRGHTKGIPNTTARMGGERHQQRRQARAGIALLESEEGGGNTEKEENPFESPPPSRVQSISTRPKAHSRFLLPEAEEARALHAEDEGLKLMEEEDAVAQLILERRNTMDGRGLTVIPQCVLRLAPLSVNIDFQLAFALLLFVDDVLRTIDLDLLQQSVKDIRTSEGDAESPSWRAMLGPVDGALTEVIRGSGDGAGKVFLGTLDVGRVMLVINIRNKRRGGEEEEQPHSELIRGVLAIMKSSPYISDANLVFASELHQNLCGPLVTLVSDILQKYIGQAIKQIFQLLGAVDLFGNPVIMCKHWKSGAVGCFFEVRRGLALWGTPGFAFLSFGRGFALCGTAFVAGFLDSFGRFFGSWFQCLEAFARNSDAYSVLPEMQGQGGVADQPGSIAEGLVSGGKGFAFTLALSLANFCVKPVKATQMHLSQHSAGNKTERLAAGAKGLGIGIASGLGSLCFGIPSSLLLFLSSSCVGTLNQIQAVPMLESVRPRRVFGIGDWRADSYSLALALAHSSFPRASRASSAQFVFTIPVYRQREEGEGPLDTEERLQRLELRLQQHSRIHHHQRRRKTHVFLAIGLRKLGLLEGKKVLWSCFRGDVAQLQIVKSFSGDGNNPTNNTFFLSLLHFKTEGKPPPDEGLARHVREGLRQRANLGDVNLVAADASTASGSSYRSSAIASSSSSSSSYSDTDDTEDIDFDFSESSSDISATIGGPSYFGGPSADALRASSDGPAAAASKAVEAEVAAKEGQKAVSEETPGIADSQPRKSLAKGVNGAGTERRSGSPSSGRRQQQQQQQQQRRWRVLKQAKIGGWLLRKGRSEYFDALKKMFALRWIEFASEAAALQAFDVLSHLLDSAPGQGTADPTLFTIL